MEMNVSTIIGRPIDVVFAFVSDVTNDGQWLNGIDKSWLDPGETYQFGVTRLTAYSGGITEGFYTFRAEMEERGHGCPKVFDPPSHWNELYDNKLWWLPANGQDNPENRRKYYSLSNLKEEAAKARDLGCEARCSLLADVW